MACALAAVVAVVLASGSSDQAGRRPTPAASGASGAAAHRRTPPSPGTAGAAVSSVSAAPGSPAETVQRFYRLATQGSFDQAWALLSPSYRSAFGGFDAFRRSDLATLRSIEFQQARTVSVSGDTASVYIQTVATHPRYVDRCSGAVPLTRVGGAWRLEPGGISCSHG